MKRRTILTGLLLCLLAPFGASARDNPPLPEAAAPLPVGPVPVIDDHPTPVYVEAEYLLWWLRPAPVSAPLVASPAAPFNLAAGTANLSNPAVRVAFGNRSVDAGPFSGLRLRLGLAATASGEPGVEVGALFLPRSTDRSTFATPATSPNGLLLPFVDTSRSPPAEGGLAVAGNLAGAAVSGSVDVASETEVWGAHVAATALIHSDGAIRLEALAGGRYFFVSDTLTLTATSANGPEGFRTFDRFLTRNYFFGALGGARAGWSDERFEARARFDLAVGVVANNLRVAGQTVRPASAIRARPGPAAVNGGVFSLGSLGVSREARVAVLPELGLDFAYRLSDGVRLRAGYNFLYFSDARRAGDQVPRGVNARALPVAGGDFTNPPAAAPIFRRTDLTLHGISAGIEVQF